MDSWDVFHSDRLEVERGLTTAEVRAAAARGDLREDDLIRPAASSIPWARLSDMPALLEPEPAPELPPPPAPPRPPLDQAQEFDVIDDLGALRTAYEDENEALRSATPPQFPDDNDEDEEEIAGAIIDEDLDELDLQPDPESRSRLALPVGPNERWDQHDEEEFDPQDEDEAAAEFTLSRGAPDRVEELDLAAMVDVAFQLVLFFLVTATTILYKSLEVPKPNPESPANAAQQGKRTLDDLKEVYILVDIDASGSIKIDREPVAADMAALIERLRSAREKTERKAMLLTADYATQHRNAVLAYDAANEIGLGIAIARPAPPAAPPPTTLKKPGK